MSSRIARIVIILTLLATAIFLAALTIPVFRAGVAHALYQQSAANITQIISTDNQTTQETEWGIEQSGKQAELSNTISSNSNEKLDPGAAEKISTMKPTDDIRLTVKFIIYEAITPMGKIIREIHPEVRTRIKAAIEALPDTSIIGYTENGLGVQTKVGNIEALTEMPEIAGIYYGPTTSPGPPPIQLLSPNNGYLDCPVDQPSFSWSPKKEVTTKFKFVLAKDAAMTQIVKEVEVTGTSYDYDGTMAYGTKYYWRVTALEPELYPGSATFSFQTEAAPPPPEFIPQQISWKIAVIVIALAASSGIVIWLIIKKRQKSKG